MVSTQGIDTAGDNFVPLVLTQEKVTNKSREEATHKAAKTEDSLEKQTETKIVSSCL